MQFPHADAERFGVDVCLSKENLESAPECPHGKPCACHTTETTGCAHVITRIHDIIVYRPFNLKGDRGEKT